MPYLRRLPSIPANGRITARLATSQRDLLLGSASLPKELGHALHRAAVREGKLNVTLKQAELDVLIMAASAIRAPGKAADREFAKLLDYLESLADRFENPGDSAGGN